MTHLETLISEFLEWQGYLIRRNTKVGKLTKGGWEMELDIVAFNPKTKDLVHVEPSIDALSWTNREERYEKKFKAGMNYIKKDLFPWLPIETKLRQVAVFISHPEGRNSIAGGQLISVDELMSEIRARCKECGPMRKNAIPEQFLLLRTIQMASAGYAGVLADQPKNSVVLLKGR